MEITKSEVTKGFQEESTGVEIAMWNDNGAVMVKVFYLFPMLGDGRKKQKIMSACQGL